LARAEFPIMVNHLPRGMVNGCLSRGANYSKRMETHVEMAWRTVRADGDRIPLRRAKTPETTQIYASLSGLRQSFDSRSN
jgi:hypothetical protein